MQAGAVPARLKIYERRSTALKYCWMVISRRNALRMGEMLAILHRLQSSSASCVPEHAAQDVIN